MSSSSSSNNFWTQTSGICTLVALVIGSVLAAVTLWYTLLSYRQLRSSAVLPITTTYGEPPPPYTIQPNTKKDSKKSNSLSDSSTFESSDDLLRGRVAERCEGKRKGRLGRRRWFVLLLIVAILLSAGVIALAANISKIRSLRFVELLILFVSFANQLLLKFYRDDPSSCCRPWLYNNICLTWPSFSNHGIGGGDIHGIYHFVSYIRLVQNFFETFGLLRFIICKI